MAFPDHVRQTLFDVGQAAAEVPCEIEDCREFVSVYAFAPQEIWNFKCRFPYFDWTSSQLIYRVIRFRTRSELIDQDVDVNSEDLLDHQEIYLPSEDAVEFVLNIWKVSVDSLLPPRQVPIPV